jgi:hypothetical protein
MSAPLPCDFVRPHDGDGRQKERYPVQRIRGFYFYTLGSNLRALKVVAAGSALNIYSYALLTAKSEIEFLQGQDLMPLKSSRGYAITLHSAIVKVLDNQPDYVLTMDDLYAVWSALDSFEIAYNAENSIADTFVVTPKAGYDTTVLIESGEKNFPPELATKAPDAVDDIRNAGKCLAFGLGTACGFHLLRAFETVVLAYRKHLLNSEADPANRNLGRYIKDMEDAKVGDPKILGTLRQIKDLHRNSLLHPEDNLTVEEAVRLLGIVVSAVGAMIDQLPEKASAGK